MDNDALAGLAARLVAVGIGALVLLAPSAAHPHHKPSAYCSESGDVCASARKEDGVRTLRIGLAAKYFSRYRLCVTAPDGTRECKSFNIGRLENGIFGDVVRWREDFENKGPGAYNVRWKSDGFKSRILGFHE